MPEIMVDVGEASQEPDQVHSQHLLPMSKSSLTTLPRFEVAEHMSHRHGSGNKYFVS